MVSSSWAPRLLALLCLSACGKAPESPEAEAPPESVEEMYRRVSQRLVDDFTENNWVVSRNADGSPDHQGEGLIWTGLALAALPCDLGDPLEAMLQDMMERHGGQLVRFEPLGEYAGGREVTFDGAVGLYRGITHRITRCGRADMWAPVLLEHRDWVFSHGYRLNENTDPALLAEFSFVLDLLASVLESESPPNANTQFVLELEIATWAWAVTQTHAAAYRLHLGYQTLRTIEELGEGLGHAGKWNFCDATVEAAIPIIDHWCARGDLKQWIADFNFNEWEYRHQRGSWETPDGDGDTTPALDLLLAMRQAYDLKP